MSNADEPAVGEKPPATTAVESETEVEDDGDDALEDYGPPFVSKTFGGAFVWARSDGFVSTVLRIIAGKSVPVATENRGDMHVMLTGGRAILEVEDSNDVDRVELLPAAPVKIDPDKHYRLIAITEVELFTVYSPVHG